MPDRNPNDTSWTRPIRDAVAVTASAQPLVAGECRGIYLGTGGDLTVTFIDGSSVTMAGMAGGVWHPVAVTHITAIAGGAANVLVGY